MGKQRTMKYGFTISFQTCFILPISNLKKKYNARYNVEKKGNTVCKQLFSIIIILHKISKQKKPKTTNLSLKFLFHIADHYIM